MDEWFLPLLIILTAIISILCKPSKKDVKKQPPAPQAQDPALQDQALPQDTAQPVPQQTPAAPHNELQSTLVAHVPPQHHLQVTPHTEDMFAGSMNYDTTEGEDPCHEHDLAPAVNPCELAPQPAAPSATGGLNLTWTGDSMVKAMVMNEILTRPCDRAKR